MLDMKIAAPMATCDSAMTVLQRKDAAPLVRNFALVYLEMAMDRASAEARAGVLPDLLQGIAAKPPQHRDMLLRMATAALQHFVVTGMTCSLSTLSAVSRVIMTKLLCMAVESCGNLLLPNLSASDVPNCCGA